MGRPTCESCKWFLSQGALPWGFCKRRSPVAEAHVNYRFPQVPPTEWCGDHEPEEEHHAGGRMT